VTLRRLLVGYLVILHVLVAAIAAVLARDVPWVLLPIELALVAWLALGLYLSRRIFGAVAMVNEAEQLLEDGDFMSRVREVGQPEVDRMIRVFNRMSNSLREERVQLQEQHNFLGRILAVSPLGAMFLDFDGRVCYVNPAAERLLGERAALLMGRRTAELGGPIGQALAELPADRSVVVSVWGGRRVRCQHGTFSDRGFERGYLLVEELTEELRQFEKAAYGKLIRTLSHEVNNSVGASNSLLHSCLNYSRYLPDEHRCDFESALSIVIGRTEQLNAFMRGFADVIRLPPPALAPCDLRKTLTRVERLLRPQLLERNIEWRWELAREPGSIRMDPAQMEQVFLNVAKNAMEAIEAQGTITVRFDSRDGRPSVVIEDTGPGLSPEARQNLFTPFYSTKEHGQGIGLTLVQEILSQHRFQYSLDSPPGGPTRFEIVF
jgi:nitrogen fixation/metabolism regulation signal transduction histidine kinase